MKERHIDGDAVYRLLEDILGPVEPHGDGHPNLRKLLERRRRERSHPMEGKTMRRNKVLRGKKLIPRVTTLGQLRLLARDDERYAKLMVIASANLGGPGDTHDLSPAAQDKAMRWLSLNATETDSESGVVAEVNYCRDLV